MTAKEQLRQRVAALTDDEAAETLRLCDQRGDPLSRFLDEAPLDEDPLRPEEEAAVQIAREEIVRGDSISLEAVRAQLDADQRLTCRQVQRAD